MQKPCRITLKLYKIRKNIKQARYPQDIDALSGYKTVLVKADLHDTANLSSIWIIYILYNSIPVVKIILSWIAETFTLYEASMLHFHL
jgi:hypothetical protein